MKNVLLITIVVVLLLFVTFAINEKDFLDKAFESSVKFKEKEVPAGPPEPIAITGLSTQENSEQLKISKLSPTALYIEVENDLVYSSGYVYTAIGIERFTLEGENIEEDWLKDKGTAVLDINQYELDKENYLIVYACRELQEKVFYCNGENWIIGMFEINDNGLLGQPYADIEPKTNLPLPPPPVGELN